MGGQLLPLSLFRLMASFIDVDPLVHRKQQRAKLHALQRQLNRLNEERRRLRHDLASQKLDRLMTSGVNSPLRDLKRGITVDAKQLKNEIGRQLPLIAEAQRAQELLAAYQLTGCTTFIYKDVYLSIRLDTFYNRRYYEPYYLILDGPMIRWTTLPWFITSTSDVENALLPGSLDVLIRAYQEALMGYIARREQIKEFQVKVNEMDNLELKGNMTLCDRLTIIHHIIKGASYHIDLHYFNPGSMFPSDIKVVQKSLKDKGDLFCDPYDVERIVKAFTTKKLLQAYQSVF